jgi:hypothetical protein
MQQAANKIARRVKTKKKRRKRQGVEERVEKDEVSAIAVSLFLFAFLPLFFLVCVLGAE